MYRLRNKDLDIPHSLPGVIEECVGKSPLSGHGDSSVWGLVLILSLCSSWLSAVPGQVQGGQLLQTKLGSPLRAQQRHLVCGKVTHAMHGVGSEGGRGGWAEFSYRHLSGSPRFCALSAGGPTTESNSSTLHYILSTLDVILIKPPNNPLE